MNETWMVGCRETMVKMAMSQKELQKHRYMQGGQARGAMIGATAGLGAGALLGAHRGVSGRLTHLLTGGSIPAEHIRKLPRALRSLPLMAAGTIGGMSIGEAAGVIRGARRHKRLEGSRK